MLMQELYGRHFLAALGGFDAIPDQDQPAIDAHKMWEHLQHGLGPQGRKPVEIDAAAVKVIEQLGVEAGPQGQIGTSRPLTRTRCGNICSTAWVHKAESRSRLMLLL